MFKQLSQSIRNSVYEFSEFERLFSLTNRESRRLVFYSEGGFYSRYFVDYLEFVLDNSELDICYLTSDVHDPIFQSTNERVKSFYVKNLLSAAFNRLDAKVLVMTVPDLHRCGIRRAPDSVKHIYAFHGVSSIHQSYRLGAFDYYDTILCINRMQIDELRKSEHLYRSKSKDLILTGYPYLERLNREHLAYRQSRGAKPVPICLISPTWAPIEPDSTIMDNCLGDLLESLAKTPYEVWLRPHNEYIKRNPIKMQKIARMISKFPSVKLQTRLTSTQIIHDADILITDHSSIAYDYALGTERPVVFIDTPIRSDNPERDRLEIEPFENTYREKIGVCVSPNRLNEIDQALTYVRAEEHEFRKRLVCVREELLANWQSAVQIGGSYILNSCL